MSVSVSEDMETQKRVTPSRLCMHIKSLTDVGCGK